MKNMPNRNTPEVFWRQVHPEGACMVYTGCRTDLGYGRLQWEGRSVYAHRLAFFLRMGRWPAEGLELRHLCNNPPCVLHVVEGTRSENMHDRRVAGTNHNVNKTHCPAGHPYDEANTRWYQGRRFCLTCKREYGRAVRAAQRAARSAA